MIIRNLNPPPLPPRRLINEINLNSFSQALSNLSWNEVLNENSASLSFDIFLSTFNNLYELFFPIIQPRGNKKHLPINPYMSKSLLKCRLKKQSLAKKSRFNPTLDNKDKYIRYRNVYNKTLRTAKKIHYRGLIARAGKDSRKVWSILKNSMGISQKSNRIECLEVNGVQISDSILIANTFNNHFSSIGRNLTPQIPSTDKHFSEFLPPPNPNSFFQFPINIVTMRNTILSIKPKKSTDINGFSSFLLHRVADSIAFPLSHIFNNSIASGEFPEAMKISKTIPIFKSGSPLDPDNYRGVTITDSFSKTFERIQANRLMSFLEDNNFLYNRQFGFRPKFSTNQAILAVLNYISSNLKSGKLVINIMLDVKKCFDMLNHKILLKKLENLGIRGIALTWFKSYLSGRKQKVFLNGTNSDTLCDILLGVFQGSILGVILFLIFINDIFMVNNELISNLFADDDTVLGSADNIQDLIAKTNIDLRSLVQWYNANQLLIHPKKTKTLIFNGPRSKLDLNKTIFDELYLPIFIDMNNHNECDISKISPLKLTPNKDEDSARLLGFQVDEKLNLKCHFKLVYSKVARAVFTLNQMKNLLDLKHLKILYSAYVKSQIDYCSNLYCLASKSTINPIFMLEKRAIRILSGKGFRDHTLPLFKKEKILPIFESSRLNILKTMFDYRHNNLPSVFNNTWQLVLDNNPYEVRNANDFNVNIVVPSFLKDHHPLFVFPSTWNLLPDRIKDINNRKEFLSNVFEWLLDTLDY